MMRALPWLVAAMSLAACSFDTGGFLRNDAGGGEEIDAASPDATPADAAPPDAATVTCDNNGDCQDPANPCQVAGTCDTAAGVCVFPDKDCTGVADDCNRGVCNPANGECEQQPAFDGNVCGDEVTCEAFSDCGEFDPDDVCDETGTRSRECTDFTCNAGTCVGAVRTEVEACERDQEDVSCDDTTCGDFSSCEFDSTCDETGSQSRECMVFTCQSATCTATPTIEVQTCTRPSRDGVTCMPNSCGDFSGCGGFTSTCDESGTRVRSCTRFRCDAEVCEGEAFTDNAPCSRNTDGDPCGHITERICTGMGSCPGPCVGGSCMNVCEEFECSDGSCPVPENGGC